MENQVRRSLIHTGFVTALSSVVGVNLATLIAGGAEFALSRRVLESDLLFGHLIHNVPEFSDFDQKLSRERFPYFFVTSGASSVPHLDSLFSETIPFATINRSYGRFANFKASEVNPLEAYVVTKGVAGATLRASTNLRVVSKYSPALQSRPYFTDALPHHFNQEPFAGKRRFKEYWLDSTSRSPIEISFKSSAVISAQRRNEIQKLSAIVSDYLKFKENEALSRILDLVPHRSFDLLVKGARSPNRLFLP